MSWSANQLPHGVEQAVGRLLVVAAIEEAEEPAAVVVLGDVPLVQNGRDPPADFAAAIGQERLHGVACVEGMRLVADQLLLVVAQRRNPVRIVAVQRPREVEKLPFLAGSDDALNGEVGHGRRF